MIASWLIDQFLQQGVGHVCIAPGSRSTPLVLAAAEHPKAKLHVHYDERGLGFFALGLAKGTQEPVLVIVTSGTAVGNLLPSVMEAYHSHIPLIYLTADRPHELRDSGANQTCDQVKIFQPFVHWQTDLACDVSESAVRSIGAQAFFHAKSGPVHLNCPFKEPLYRPTSIVENKPIHLTFPTLSINSYRTDKAKGVILAGKFPKKEDTQAVLALAQRLKWPVLADILSNARCTPTPEQMRYFDWNEKPSPEYVLHFGERMTSKKVLSWLKTLQTEYVHVSPYPTLQDPERILTGRVQADIASFCSVFEASYDPEWFSLWQDVEPLFEETGAFTEVHAMRQISNMLPPNFGVFLGNGMPIRDGDHFLFPKHCGGFFANRGLSGIDGNIATLAALSETMPMLGFIGDQAALYDLNSLPLLKKTKHPVILIISNNFGGGIFHHLPVAASPHFETLWANSHSWRFQEAAKLFDLPFAAFESLQTLPKETTLIELVTDRHQNFLSQSRQLTSSHKHRQNQEPIPTSARLF